MSLNNDVYFNDLINNNDTDISEISWFKFHTKILLVNGATTALSLKYNFRFLSTLSEFKRDFHCGNTACTLLYDFHCESTHIGVKGNEL